MSLHDTLNQLRLKIAEWMKRQQRIRQRRLNVVRLEDRRLPDASFALVGDLLSADGFDAGDSLNIELDSAANELQLTLLDGQWDSSGLTTPFMLSPDQKLLTVDLSIASVNGLQIDASVNPLSSITGSGGGLTLSQLLISGGGAVVFDNAANDFDQIDVQADSLELRDSSDLEIVSLDLSNALTLTADGSITDVNGASITVGAHAQIVGAEITLGDDSLDATEFGSITFITVGEVSIIEDGDMNLSGINSADSLYLEASGSISDELDTDLTVTGMSDLTSDDIVLGDDSDNNIFLGSLKFSASGNVTLNIDSDVDLAAGSQSNSAVIISSGNIESVAAGADVAITAADISLVSMGAIGSSTQAVLLNTDHLQTETSNNGNQFLSEVDAVEAQLLNAGNGEITITAGIFRVTNTVTAAHVNVGADAVLGGTGSIVGAVSTVSGARVAPGQSPGILNTGDFTLVSGAALEIEIDGSTAGVEYDPQNRATHPCRGQRSAFPGRLQHLDPRGSCDPRGFTGPSDRCAKHHYASR